jgi:hypothetical protein
MAKIVSPTGGYISLDKMSKAHIAKRILDVCQ